MHIKFRLYYFTLPFFFIILLVLINSSGNSVQLKNEKADLVNDTVWVFNKNDIKNLKVILEDSTLNPQNLYSIQNGTIIFLGGFKGYIRTKEKFSDFYFHAEWKWIEKNGKGNSGILLFLQNPDTVWPNCIQVNFKEKHAGDLIAMNGAEFKEAQGKPNNTAVMLTSSTEKSEGEWNSCDISSFGDSLVININGSFQNKATGIRKHTGTIGWQLEGKPVAFRNIFLIKK